MESKYIVSLREEINTDGKSVTRTVFANDFKLDASPSFTEVENHDGRKFLIHKNNIKSIIPKK